MYINITNKSIKEKKHWKVRKFKQLTLELLKDNYNIYIKWCNHCKFLNNLNWGNQAIL